MLERSVEIIFVVRCQNRYLLSPNLMICAQNDEKESVERIRISEVQVRIKHYLV
jgi:hypothetical protein